MSVPSTGGCSHGARRANAVAGEFLKIKIARTQRIFACIGASQRQKVVHDLRKPSRFVERDGQRFAVFLGSARLRKRHFCFPANDGDRRAQFVRSVGHKPPLLFKRAVQPFKQAVERGRQITKLIARILHRQALVQVPRADVRCRLAHGDYWSQALARQEIAADAGDQQRRRNHPQQCGADILHKVALQLERLKRDEGDPLRRYLRPCEVRAKMNGAHHHVPESAIGNLALDSPPCICRKLWHCRRVRGVAPLALASRRERLTFGQQLVFGIQHSEAMIAQPELLHRLLRRCEQRVAIRILLELVVVFGVQGGDKAVGSFHERRIRAPRQGSIEHPIHCCRQAN